MAKRNPIKYEINGNKHTVLWNFDLDNIDKAPIEMRNVANAKHSTESYFKIRVTILKDNFNGINMQIDFSYPKALYIKSSLFLTKGPDFKDGTIIKNSDYSMIIPDKWNYLGILKQFDEIRGLLILNIFNLNFEFYVIDNEKLPPIVKVKKFNNSDKFSDVVIQSSDGKEHKVHKFMLASASEVFKAHFEHNTIECHTNIIKCQFESDVLEAILAYIYDGDVPAVNAITETHLHAADFYQLIELKDLCERALSKNLTAQNVIRMLGIGYSCNAASLTQSALEFIKLDSSHAIFKSEDWANFESVTILKKIIKYLKTSTEIIVVYHDVHNCQK